MKKIILYPHGGSENHGCEAIVRSTALILQQEMILFSSAEDQDRRYGLSSICSIQPLYASICKDLSYLIAAVRYNFLSDRGAYDKLIFRNIINQAKVADVALSIGGDNYCYGMPEHIMFINKELRKVGIPTVLWGCSIEPSAINEKFIADLREYKLIVSRESITTTALRNVGLDNVMQAPDPAFVLPASPVDVPYWWKDGDTIGINASPMILDCSADISLTLANYETLIEYILSSTNSTIALIPHVLWAHNDDRKPLRYLLDKYSHSNRVYMLEEDYNAEQLKWIISKCRALVTARTHASIAAYSMGVPTIVMGYSVKARGIAFDLFGDEYAYVLPVQGLNDRDQLKHMFQRLIDAESDIKYTLHQKMSQYRTAVLHLRNALESIL